MEASVAASIGSQLVDYKLWHLSSGRGIPLRGPCKTTHCNALQVGDYVLSPDMCVERKAIPDLRQSLASGRLFHQVGSCKGYCVRSAAYASILRTCIWTTTVLVNGLS
jgi:ERCC4 domain